MSHAGTFLGWVRWNAPPFPRDLPPGPSPVLYSSQSDRTPKKAGEVLFFFRKLNLMCNLRAFSGAYLGRFTAYLGPICALVISNSHQLAVVQTITG
jgi:hypothetical protein